MQVAESTTQHTTGLIHVEISVSALSLRDAGYDAALEIGRSLRAESDRVLGGILHDGRRYLVEYLGQHRQEIPPDPGMFPLSRIPQRIVYQDDWLVLLRECGEASLGDFVAGEALRHEASNQTAYYVSGVMPYDPEHRIRELITWEFSRHSISIRSPRRVIFVWQRVK